MLRVHEARPPENIYAPWALAGTPIRVRSLGLRRDALSARSYPLTAGTRVQLALELEGVFRASCWVSSPCQTRRRNTE